MDNPDLNINLMRGFLIKLMLDQQSGESPVITDSFTLRLQLRRTYWSPGGMNITPFLIKQLYWTYMSWGRPLWMAEVCDVMSCSFWKMEATNPVYLWSATASRWPHPTPAELLNCLTSFCPAWIPSSRSSRSSSSFCQLRGLGRYLAVFSWDLPPPAEYLQATCFPGSLHKTPQTNQPPEI